MSAVVLRHAQNRIVRSGGQGWWGGGRRLLAGLVAVLLVLAGVQIAGAPTSAPAAADPTGTGGQYVPITAANLVDTWNGIGLPGPLTPTPQVVQVNGAAGLPTTGVASIVATITIVSGASVNGVVYGQANTGGTSVGQSLLAFEESDTASNTVTIENGDDGKIKLWSQGTNVDVRVDVQGYFTTGNGAPAPGGYVAGTADLGTTSALSAGQTSNPIQVTGQGQIPTTATAVYANLEVDSTAATGPGRFVAFPTGTTPPPTLISYEYPKKVSIGTIIDLDAAGRFSIKMIDASPSVPIKIRILGYFDGQSSNPAWTPLGYRIFDSSSSANVAAGTTQDVQVAGVQGIPSTICNAAGVVFHVEADQSPVDGSLTVWPSDASMPAAATMNFTSNALTSNTVISRVGCTDGKIKVRNNSSSGSIKLVVDAQSYLSNSDVVGPASGSNVAVSGSRGSQQNASRSLNDRTTAAVNPTNGNLLLTQQLLNITGVGPSVGIGVRYNALNDNRPTLNVGLFETQLYRNSDGSITYTDPSGTAFKFTPGGSGTNYNVPNDINAHLNRTVNGSPDAAVSNGATYELVFHPSQIKNVYQSDGANLKLIRTEDVTGQNKITYNYDGGRLTSLLDTQGRTVTFGYSSSPNPTQPTTIVDGSLNRTITLAYAGPKGALSQVTAANGQNTTWAYNAAGKVSSITDGSGRRTDFTYDGNSRVSTEVFGANNTSVSGTWTWTYPLSTQTKATDPNSNVVTYDYTSAKQVTKVTDGRGKATTSAFNTHGDLTGSTNPTGAATTYTVASSDFTYNLTKVTAPTGTGGAAGRASEATYPTATGNGATTDYRPLSTKDAQGNVSNLTYNTWGQTATEDRGVPAGGGAPANGTWSYKYQAGSGGTAASCGGKAGQICSVTDGNGNTTSFTYNAAGNLATKTLPAPLGAETYTYDAAGRLKTKVDGNGVTTYTCYDPDDRVFQVSTTSATCGTASGVRTTYDAAGNATGINNTTTTTVATIAFDAQNRPTSRTFTGGLNPSALASSATYDRAGRILTMSDGGTGAANTTTYTYDASNNVVTLAEPGGSCASTPGTKCTRFTYDDNNQRTVTSYPNGVTSTVGYDTGQRWLNQTVTAKNTSGNTVTLLSRAWTYSTTGTTSVDTALVTTETDESGNKFTYTYDGANELKTAVRTSSGGTTLWNGAWELDNNGNRTKQVINGTTTNYKYNAADQLCWYGTGTSTSCTAPSGATTLSYDANGNQTGSATYTPFNQQTTTTGSVNYAYLGTTNTQRLAANNVAYTPNLINGQTTQHTGTNTQKIIRDPAGKLIAWEPTGSTGASFYYVTDRQDSVLLLTDTTSAQAQKVAEYGYLPYGNTYTNAGTQAAANPYRYIGAFLDGTGNYKMGARYYNPTIGRFTQPDPSGQEFNRYNYSNSNPVTYSDVSGLAWDASTIIGGIATVLGIIAANVTPAGPVIDTLEIAGEVGGGLSFGISIGEDYHPGPYDNGLGAYYGSTEDGTGAAYDDGYSDEGDYY